LKILYAIQGTGNGHLVRAKEILPVLKKYADVDVLVSGTEHTLKFPYPIKYQQKGLSFAFGEDGGIDYWKTYQMLDSKKFLKSVIDLPVENYNLILNDFEPISAWAARYKQIPCYAISHQCSILGENAPMPPILDPIAYALLNIYAPCDKAYGFHFQSYNLNTYTPIIREEIQQTHIRNKGHYTIYLPAYSDNKLFNKLSCIKDIEWHVFSKNVRKKEKKANVHFYPIDKDSFVKSMSQSAGVICGAGFETPSEALYLGKKLLVIPMKGQFEQQCNAYALEKMGVTILKNLKDKHIPKLEEWLNSSMAINVDYTDQRIEIIEKIIDNYSS
jgi:uncharacterized protein (TIGR00661 family)